MPCVQDQMLLRLTCSLLWHYVVVIAAVCTCHVYKTRCCLDRPAVSCVKQRQPARGLKQDHDSAGAVMRIHKGDCDPSHLDGAVQG